MGCDEVPGVGVLEEAVQQEDGRPGAIPLEEMVAEPVGVDEAISGRHGDSGYRPTRAALVNPAGSGNGQPMLCIRRARHDDTAALRDLHMAAVRVTSASHYAADDVEAWVARIATSNYDDDLACRDVVVAEAGGCVVGLGVLDVERAEVRAVYVHPASGRRGVGRRVLAVLETLARLRGLGRLRLESSRNAVAFYAGAGWHRGPDARRTFPGGRDIACVVMTKVLPALRLQPRDEEPADAAGVRAVACAAFGRPDEADLVERLRQGGALALTLVATADAAVVGHVALSRVTASGAVGMLGLGPVAVSPPYQCCAIGSRLIEEGLARARERGARAVVVLGHLEYHSRFGFVPASRFGLCHPGAPGDAFMAAELVPNGLAGVAGSVRYHAAFDAVATR